MFNVATNTPQNDTLKRFRRLPKEKFPVYFRLLIPSRLKWRIKFQLFSVGRLWDKIFPTKKASKVPILTMFPTAR